MTAFTHDAPGWTMAGNGQDDFAAIARQYWSAWGDTLRAAAEAVPAAGAIPGMPGAGSGSGGGFGSMPGAFGGMPGGLGAMPGAFGAMPGAFGGMPGGSGAGGPFAGAGGAFGAAPIDPGKAWRDGLDWWSRAAGGGPADEALGRFNTQARDWLGQMQQVAARFAGRDASPADITGAWRQALGKFGDNPFAGMFDASQAGQGIDAWLKLAEPFVAHMREDTRGWLAVPGFGVGREHQERLQRLLQAQLDHQQHSSAFNARLQAASQAAYAVFESKLAGREAPGQQLQSARALFDLWIEAAEEAYATAALSSEFREAYGSMVNAQMRLRAAVQGEIEQVTGQLGMPTRSELDGAHRKIAELERGLRRLRVASPAQPRGPVRGADEVPAARGATARARSSTSPSGTRTSATPARKARAPKPVAVARPPSAPARPVRPAPRAFASTIPAAPTPLEAPRSQGKSKGADKAGRLADSRQPQAAVKSKKTKKPGKAPRTDRSR